MGPSPELIQLILEMKQRNPRFGCPRIALEIARTFSIDIDKYVVRCVLAKKYRPDPGDGPSRLTFIGHMKNSLWSVDLFRCESIVLGIGEVEAMHPKVCDQLAAIREHEAA